MNTGIWKVSRVDLTTDAKTMRHAHYKFRVCGVISDRPGRAEPFSWAVPSLNDAGFDLSLAKWSDEARAYAESHAQ